MQRFIQALRKAVGQASFEVPRFGTYSADDLRRLSGDNPLFLSLATTHLPEDSLNEVTSILPSLLNNHIVNDHVGDGLAFFLHGSAPLTTSRLALDSVRAAAIGSPERVARLLDDWEQGRPIACQSHAILSGVSIDDPIGLDKGITLERLPNSSNALIAKLPSTIQFNLPVMDMAGAVMIKVPFQARSAFFRSTDPRIDQYDEIADSKILGATSFDSLCEALSLVHNAFVDWRILWSTCEGCKAFGDDKRFVVWHTSSDRIIPTATLSRESFSKSYELFLGSLGQKKAAVDVAIRRWRESKRRADISDRFIDLRIALEALYLEGVNDELGFRLSNYGAWHLGENFEERREYQATLQKAYRRASQAVHADTLESTKENATLLVRAQDLCRTGILKRLDETENPNWKEMVLGKGT